MITRVLVTLAPRMYREAIALSIHRHRSDLEVRLAPPEVTEEEIESFRPHLLLYNDTAGILAGALERVLCRIEVLYSDGMDARISADGEVSEARDMSTENLLGTVDKAVALAARS